LKSLKFWHEGEAPREIPEEKYPDFHKILQSEGPEAAARYIEKRNAEIAAQK